MPRKISSRPTESWVYVLAADRKLPIEEQSRFTLRPLTVWELAAVHDDIARVEEVDGVRSHVARTRRQGVDIVLSNLVSTENFPVGEPQPWPKDKTERLRYLALLKGEHVQELANELFAKSSLEEEVKNS